MDRKIIHIDMDAFFASVEQRDDPSLRGRPVVVGGSPTGRGVVAAASYEARVYGIHSAMPARTALRLCPDLVFVRGDFARYREVSSQMRGIVSDYTALIEPMSLDECYLDVSDLPHGFKTATAVAREIRARIRDELRLTASAGVAPLKFVAKMASDFKKPDGLTVVPPARLLDFLHPLKVARLPGVGPATEAFLHEHGIHTIGDLAVVSREHADGLFGKFGWRLWERANGIDAGEVRIHHIRKSRSAERTFAEDIAVRPEMHRALESLAARVCHEMARDMLLARTVRIKVRYRDFTTFTRATTLFDATADEALVARVAITLLEHVAPVQPVRLLGVGLANLVYPDTPRQLRLDL
ncbi:MAG: DNA polymerase IV [Rhodothermales bacterium]|nr:DNA polymerase IV [Rhodothermales bacterium]